MKISIFKLLFSPHGYKTMQGNYRIEFNIACRGKFGIMYIRTKRGSFKKLRLFGIVPVFGTHSFLDMIWSKFSQ